VHAAGRVERLMHRGLPVTPVARTLLDLAAMAPFDDVRKAVAEADFKRWLDLEALDAEMGRGHRGSAALRSALALHLPQHARTRSPLEDLFLDLCRRHRIPLPDVNVRVAGCEVDALWRERRVIVEVDGADGHATRGQMERDRQRDLALRAAGFSVHRYTWRQVTTRSKLVAADLRRALNLPAASVSGRQG
jgi:very-short-patch-repair endonuclease